MYRNRFSCFSEKSTQLISSFFLIVLSRLCLRAHGDRLSVRGKYTDLASRRSIIATDSAFTDCMYYCFIDLCPKRSANPLPHCMLTVTKKRKHSTRSSLCIQIFVCQGKPTASPGGRGDPPKQPPKAHRPHRHPKQFSAIRSQAGLGLQTQGLLGGRPDMPRCNDRHAGPTYHPHTGNVVIVMAEQPSQVKLPGRRDGDMSPTLNRCVISPSTRRFPRTLLFPT